VADTPCASVQLGRRTCARTEYAPGAGAVSRLEILTRAHETGLKTLDRDQLLRLSTIAHQLANIYRGLAGHALSSDMRVERAAVMEGASPERHLDVIVQAHGILSPRPPSLNLTGYSSMTFGGDIHELEASRGNQCVCDSSALGD
jgi:hypothetical protein